MADAPEQTKPEPTPLPTLEIERNGKVIPFVSTKIVRGDNAGTLYLSPSITKDNVQQYIDWKGVDNIVDILQADANRRSQGCYDEAVAEDGVFNEQEFIKMVSSDSARGFTMKQIDEQIAAFSSEQQDLLNNLNISGDLVEYTESDGSTKQVPKELVPIKDLAKKITSLKQDKANKKRKTKEEKAVEATVPV